MHWHTKKKRKTRKREIKTERKKERERKYSVIIVTMNSFYFGICGLLLSFPHYKLIMVGTPYQHPMTSEVHIF
jgi:hypothetical protein